MEETKMEKNISVSATVSSETDKKLPEMTFRAGAVSATVWQNTGKNKDGELNTYNTISIDRSYKDKQDAWQKTNSMRINDLPKASLVMKKAFEYLVLNQQNAA